MSEQNKNTALDELDALVSRLDTQLGATGGSPARAIGSSPVGATGSLPASASKRDAIDAILASTPRSTAVKSLRDHETIVRFRKEVADGLVRVDTARQLLGLIRLAVETVVK